MLRAVVYGAIILYSLHYLLKHHIHFHSWPEIWDKLSMLYFSLKFPFMLRYSWGIRFFHFAEADVGVSSQIYDKTFHIYEAKLSKFRQNCQNMRKIVQVWVQKILRESFVKENKIVHFFKSCWLSQLNELHWCTASTDKVKKKEIHLSPYCFCNRAVLPPNYRYLSTLKLLVCIRHERNGKLDNSAEASALVRPMIAKICACVCHHWSPLFPLLKKPFQPHTSIAHSQEQSTAIIPDKSFPYWATCCVQTHPWPSALPLSTSYSPGI